MRILEQINNDLALIPAALKAWDAILEDEKVLADVKLENKSAKEVNVEQPTGIIKYGYCAVQAKTLIDFVEIKLKQRKTFLHKKLIENSNHSFTDREREKLFDDDEAYLDMQILLLEVKERYGLFSNILNAYTARGFALRNINELLTEFIGDTIL